MSISSDLLLFFILKLLTWQLKTDRHS